jgi:hypothetical protein
MDGGLPDPFIALPIFSLIDILFNDVLYDLLHFGEQNLPEPYSPL